MKPRIAVLANAESVSDAQTYKCDVDIAHPISALYINVKATNGATSNLANNINDIIEKVEIVDGSNVIASLSFKELESLHFFHTRGKVPVLRPSEFANGSQEEGAILFFGRYLWDKLLALDPTKFSNPQIQVKANIAAVRAAGATGFVSASITVTILAYVLEGLDPKPIGFLMHKNIDSWTTVASGDHTTELPHDHPIKSLMLKSLELGSDIDEGISKIKISLDEGGFIPLEADVKDIWEKNVSDFGELIYKHDVLRATAATIPLLVNHDPHVVPVGYAGARIYQTNWEWSSQVYLTILDHAGAGVSLAENTRLIVHGSALHATVFHDFGDPNDIEDWLNPGYFLKGKVLSTQANADGAASIVLSQFKKY